MSPTVTGGSSRFTSHFSPYDNVGLIELWGDLGDDQGMRQLWPIPGNGCGNACVEHIHTMQLDQRFTTKAAPSHARIGITAPLAYGWHT